MSLDHDDHPQVGWQQNLKAGDVVAFCFPHRKHGDGAPKTRPCLVLGTDRVDGHRFALLAYGTSCWVPGHEYRLKVTAARETQRAGLVQKTNFNAARRVVVSLDHQGFDTHNRHHSPVLGTLSGQSLGDMQRLIARISKYVDMKPGAAFANRSIPARAVPVERRRGRILVNQEVRYV